VLRKIIGDYMQSNYNSPMFSHHKVALSMPAQSPLSMLQVSGIDAKKLLQGQVTCNLDDVTPTSSLLGAHCNPQGRILSLFRLYWHAESYYLQMPAESVPHALKALQKYAAFYNVQLAEVASLDAIPEPPANWKLANITAGIPAIYPETTGKLLPHEINLQRLNAISFNKCITAAPSKSKCFVPASIPKPHRNRGLISIPTSQQAC
jgi:folate-binding Fe-S cluster repair protein YgfZ